MREKVSAFVVSFNRAAVIGTCLRALRFADEVIVLQSGVIVERGLTETVFRAPATQYTCDLLANTPSLESSA